MRKICSMVLMGTLLVVSSLPLLPVGTDVQATSSCPLCHMDSHMKIAAMDHTTHLMTPTMRHARIECYGHHDIDALPHLLAPHAISQIACDTTIVIMDMTDTNISVLKPRLLPFPVPPPRIS